MLDVGSSGRHGNRVVLRWRKQTASDFIMLCLMELIIHVKWNPVIYCTFFKSTVSKLLRTIHIAIKTSPQERDQSA